MIVTLVEHGTLAPILARLPRPALAGLAMPDKPIDGGLACVTPQRCRSQLPFGVEVISCGWL